MRHFGALFYYVLHIAAAVVQFNDLSLLLVLVAPTKAQPIELTSH